MDLLGKVKKLLGARPVSVSELNRRATAPPAPTARPLSPPRPKPAYSNPLADITVSKEYREVRSRIAAGDPIVFVTGHAGTGKSTLIRYLRHSFRCRKLAVLAPTGVAALNAGGVTIHSFFRFPPKIHEEHDIKLLSDRKLYQKLDLLIIDEVSMVRCDLLDSVDGFLRKNRSSTEPFGGVQLVVIGDLHQLPPVVPEQERRVLQAARYESCHFFSAFGLQASSLTAVELTSTYRQKDSAFIVLLNRIRVGEEVDSAVAELNRRCLRCDDFSPDITLTCTNHAADEINTRELDRLPPKEHSFKGKIQGRFNLQEDKLPSPLDLRLKVGARVMFTKNDEQGRRWVNGTLGVVREISESSIRVELVDESRSMICDVFPATWETYEYAYDAELDQIVADSIGKYTQYPLMLAWAVTIHKSQGRTLDNVLIDLGHGAFASGQVYVALSRCRRIEGIRFTRPLRSSDVKCDPTVKRFYQALEMLARNEEEGADSLPVPTELADGHCDEEVSLH